MALGVKLLNGGGKALRRGGEGLERLQRIEASGIDARHVRERLGEALEHGMLVLDRSSDSFRFRHDRVHQCVHARLQPASRRQLLLSVARRLAATSEYEAAAAEPYSRTGRPRNVPSR